MALPPRLFSTTPVPVSLWYLRRAEVPCPKVLLVDARHLGTGTGRRNMVGEDGLGAVLKVVRPWLLRAALGSVTDGEPCPRTTLVRRGTLAESDYSSSPMDHVPESSSAGRPAREKLLQAHGEAAGFRGLVHVADTDAAALDWDRVMGVGHASGLLPPGWTEARLAELCEIQPGPSYTRLGKGDWSLRGEVPVVFPPTVGRREDPASRGRTGLQREGPEAVQLQAGGRGHRPTGELRPPALVGVEQEGMVLSTHLVRLRVRRTPGWTRGSSWTTPRCRTAPVDAKPCGGHRRPSLSRDVLGHLPVRFPPVSEQREIVRVSALLRKQAVLHREYAEALGRAREELLKHLMLGASTG